MNMSASSYPVPQITAISKPFWDACQQHKLQVQKCDSCGRFRFYPSEACPDCRSTSYKWVNISGRGKILTWIVVHRSVDPVWQERVPFVTGIVEIEEQKGCFIPGIILGRPPADVQGGMPVKVEFEETNPGVVVPRWRVQ
ncbi:Zn-ribbon domain-containing OB-fold protein [Ferrovibrio sp.]|uniref:Zn-ribbon domain-containing OB-fold protein n=1 Tax=Ferrovibrio sp. TaxID=1917215 RepID=UPI0035B07F50